MPRSCRRNEDNSQVRHEDSAVAPLTLIKRLVLMLTPDVCAADRPILGHEEIWRFRMQFLMIGRQLNVLANDRTRAAWLVQIVVATILGAMAVLYFWYGIPGKFPLLNDFGSFRASGRAAIEGLNPYGIYAETFRIPGTDIIHPNLNPPASLLLFAPLSLLDSHLSARFIWWSGLLAYAAIVAVALRRQPETNAILPMAAWALALPAFWDGLRLGQVYLLMLVLVAGAWHMLEHRREIAAGLLIGIFVALKPIFLFWPGLLFLAGHKRAAVWTGFWFMAVSLLPVLVFGPAVYGQWLDLIMSEAGNRKGVFPNASLMAIGYRAGSPFLAMLLAVITLIWMTMQILRNRIGTAEASAIGIALGIVLSPVAWFHYLIFLLPAMLTRRWSGRILAVAVFMLVPIAPLYMVYEYLPAQMPALAEPIRATLGSVFSWTALLLLSGLSRERY